MLRGGQAYDTFDAIIGDFSPELRGVVPAKAGRSAYQIVEHLRRSLRDILDFSQNEDGSYKESAWPDDYWPQDPAPPRQDAWDEAVQAYKRDLSEMEGLVSDRASDLFRPFPWGDGQTLLREALLAADHAAYHLGELVMLRRVL